MVKNTRLPSNAGIDTDTCPSAMHMTHTHDDSENYTWRTIPKKTCLLRYSLTCGVSTSMKLEFLIIVVGTVEMTVNGTASQDFEKHILGDQQNIVIFYTSAQGE